MGARRRDKRDIESKQKYLSNFTPKWEKVKQITLTDLQPLDHQLALCQVTMTRKKKGPKSNKKDKTMLLMRSFGQAIKLINEQKEKERQKIRQAEIRRLALEQKAKKEAATQKAGRMVLIHI